MATTEIYTLSLHDALPICLGAERSTARDECSRVPTTPWSSRPNRQRPSGDRKSTRLNSSHTVISYAVFCLKKKMRNRPDVTNINSGYQSKIILRNKRRRTE